jgi:hypothetical protein
LTRRRTELQASVDFAASKCVFVERTGPIEATPGFRLAALVARYAQRVFDTRASLLNDERADEYRRRSRDPAPSVASLVRPRPAVSVVRCAAADAAAAAVPAASVAPPPPRS